jgi:hypothetical protein
MLEAIETKPGVEQKPLATQRDKSYSPQKNLSFDQTDTPIQVPPGHRTLIIQAVTRSLAKSLLLSAAVLGPGLLLLAQGQQLFGMLWLFVGSFGMMAWTYRKPWRLMVLTCLLPPFTALLSYLIQLLLFDEVMPSADALLIATGAGVLVGYWRARSHQIYNQDGSIFAQRTTKYLIVWILAFGCTQILGAVAQSVLLVTAGLLTGAFSTAMLLMVSVVLLDKRATLMKSLAR